MAARDAWNLDIPTPKALLYRARLLGSGGVDVLGGRPRLLGGPALHADR